MTLLFRNVVHDLHCCQSTISILYSAFYIISIHIVNLTIQSSCTPQFRFAIGLWHDRIPTALTFFWRCSVNILGDQCQYLTSDKRTADKLLPRTDGHSVHWYIYASPGFGIVPQWFIWLSKSRTVHTNSIILKHNHFPNIAQTMKNVCITMWKKTPLLYI